MKIIGLTGGIASGKSTVASILKKLGAKIIDADIVARRVVGKGQPALEKIVDYFGRDMLNEDGSLNRKKLGELVFGNKEALRKLNEFTHPEIRLFTQKLFDIEKNKGTDRIIYDCPLLIEGNLMGMVDKIWLVYVDKQTQLKRLMERDHFSKEQALKRINNQLSLEKKIKYADVLIHNHGDIAELEKKVIQLWKEERSL